MYFMHPGHQYDSYFAGLIIRKIQEITRKLHEDTDMSNNNPLKYYQLQIFYLENKTFL